MEKRFVFLLQNFLIWMLDMCWDSFYLDASFSRKHLCLQFVKDLLTIFRSGYELEPIFSALVDWITVLEEKNENSESRLFQLIGLFHDSVQMNKVSEAKVCKPKWGLWFWGKLSIKKR